MASWWLLGGFLRGPGRCLPARGCLLGLSWEFLEASLKALRGAFRGLLRPLGGILGTLGGS
jgi:hypothetical protein